MESGGGARWRVRERMDGDWERSTVGNKGGARWKVREWMDGE